MTRFDEGWFLGALPHLASWLYTWAFLLPFGGLADRIALAAHLEFAVLVGTVITLPVLVDRLLPRPRVRSAWAAFFLFPGILVYDSGLGGGADHVLAFWGAPIFLALLALLRRPNPASAVLLAALMSGAALTKYQAIYLLLAPGAAALIGARRCPRTVATLVVGLALLTAPHWLLNWLWYGNPAYPAAYAVFGGHPMAPTIEPRLPADHPFLLEGSFPERVLKTLRALLTFGFEAHDWSSFHGQRPVYGSLFLPALALALVVRVRHVVLGLAAAGLVGIAAWFWTYHEDRYLQALTPWLAACTLAGLASTWRQVPIARPLLALVVMLQLASCADLYFLGTHAMSGWPLQKSAELISSGFRRAYGERSNAYSGFAELDAMLPPDAKVLVHEQHIHLGLNRAAVRDARGRQGALAYAHLANSEMVLENLMRLGVTHAVWARNPMGHNLVGDDVVFYRFAQQLPGPRYTGSGLTVARLPDRLPRGRPGVAVIGCGVERLTPSDLSAQWMRLRAAKCLGPPPLALEAIADVDLVVTDTRLGGQQIPGFALLFARDEFQIWGRQP